MVLVCLTCRSKISRRRSVQVRCVTVRVKGQSSSSLKHSESPCVPWMDPTWKRALPSRAEGHQRLSDRRVQVAPRRHGRMSQQLTGCVRQWAELPGHKSPLNLPRDQQGATPALVHRSLLVKIASAHSSSQDPQCGGFRVFLLCVTGL